ncbi:PhnA domain-containing protein [Chryseosolibacter indicus]|uniref:PhnA domain-containing protein n=1 Tax=Chryseosolibacter indicus TaxID=2782351 RepID=A0ABS5VSA9_9BACT|nr:alkylphosphonate utilization protein [Chryseosolibacter indicus]MBT1704320.1 PhnA domain-containing protein [Chryseosolibacter indicus]
MSTENELHQRSGSVCELCSGSGELMVYEVESAPSGTDASILVCNKCFEQLRNNTLDSDHWRCLNNSMWSEIPAIQVVSWRLLNRLQQQGEGWAQDLLEMMYLDEEMQEWARQDVFDTEGTESKVVHKDSNGNLLQNGDTVVLIKDLDVKGGGFTAKRGTTVKGIVLVENNASQIEGRVNGQQIVILTQFVKRST